MNMSHLLGAAAAIVCVACAQEPVLKSTPAGDGAGIAYYLPKRLVKIQVDRTPVPEATDVAKAKADFVAARAAAGKAKGDLDAEEAILAELGKASTTSVEYKKQAAVVARANARANIAKKDQDKAQAEIGETEAAVLAGKDGNGLVDKVTVTLSAPVADRSKRFIAVPEHLQTRSDQLSLKTNAAGLLTNSDATSEDQTAAIVVALAGAVSGAISVPLRAPAGVKGIEGRPPPPSKACGDGYAPPPSIPVPFSAEFVLDPTDKGEMSKEESMAASDPRTPLEKRLCSLGANYRFNIKPVDKSAGEGVAATETAGLYYRRELPYVMSIYSARGGDTTAFVLAKDIMLSLPNESPLEVVKLESGTFTSRTFSTTFDNGILVSHTEAKPSEALAVARIPVDVMKAIFEIPTSLLQLKIDYTSKDKDLAKAQKDLADALRALDAARSDAGAAAP